MFVCAVWSSSSFVTYSRTKIAFNANTDVVLGAKCSFFYSLYYQLALSNSTEHALVFLFLLFFLQTDMQSIIIIKCKSHEPIFVHYISPILVLSCVSSCLNDFKSWLTFIGNYLFIQLYFGHLVFEYISFDTDR